MPQFYRIPLFVYGYVTMLVSVVYSYEVDLGSFKLNFPAEPIIGALSIWLLFDLDWKKICSSKWSRHPLTWASGGYLLWMGFTSFFSSNFMVSLKYLIIGAAHWWIFFVGTWHLFDKYKIKIPRLVPLLVVAMLPLIVYAWWQHSGLQFKPHAAVMAARPFYKDNTIYAVCLSMLVIPMGLYASQEKGLRRGAYLLLTIILIIALYLSFCRAAWLSLLLSICFLFLVKFWNIDFKKTMTLSFVVVALGAILFPYIENENQSKKGGAIQQIKSIANLSTDVSNLERINRYKCAWRMFKERPVLGFGAGTYPKAYLPFQKKAEMTRLSVTATRREDGSEHYSGMGGSTHSEYLRGLSELGVLGFFFWAFFFIGTLFFSLKIHRSKEDKKKQQALVVLMGLLPFFIHVLFNNFSHQEAAAMLLWSLLSYLAILDD